MPDSVWRILTILLFVIFAFLLFYKVMDVPTAFNVDEAGAAYDALSLANYHTDRYLYRFPVYFTNFGGGQNALYTYLTAFLIKIFGYSPLIVRLTAILFSISSAFVFTLVIRKEYGNIASVITTIFFIILPFSFMHSRWGLESYLLFPMLIFSCTAFYQAVRTEKTRYFLLSGVLFGITLYAYTVAYLLLPLFLGVVLLYLILIRKIRWKNIFVFGVLLFFFAIPLFLMLAVNNDLIPEIRTRYFSIPRYPFFRAHEIDAGYILTHLKFDQNNIFYNLFVNDHCAYNIIPWFGSIYYISLPFLVYGCVLCFKKAGKDIKERVFTLDLMMCILFAVMFCLALMYEGVNANRACAIYLPMIYFLVIGTAEFFRKYKTAAWLLGGVYLVIFLCFIHYYFTEFPKITESDSMFASITDITHALDFADSVNQDGETVYVLDSVQPYIFVLLARQIDPYTFNEQMFLSNDHFVKIVGNYRFRLDAVLPECIYIVNPVSIPMNDVDFDGFETRQFGSVMVYYPPAE